MAGEAFVGVAIFSIIAIVLVFGWLSSEYAKGSTRLSGSALAEKVPNVPTQKENASYELPEPPAMRRGDGERVPLQKRVQPIKRKDTVTPARTDTAYRQPVVDTFDYSEPSRSHSSSYSSSYDSSSSSSDSSSSSCD